LTYFQKKRIHKKRLVGKKRLAFFDVLLAYALFILINFFLSSIKLNKFGIPCIIHLRLGDRSMLSFIKIFLKMLKIFILFTGCTILFYYGVIWVSEEYQNYHRYDEPEGTSLKVSNSMNVENSNLLDQLILFYLNGE
jgi:hypothetical protein